MEKSFDHHYKESFWYDTWIQHNVFNSSYPENAPTFCLMLPPPNVTGSLHMGHAFQDTLMDILVRHHAQKGHRVLWQVGTDHAGIATQMVVDRLLESQGIIPQSLSREERLEKIWAWKEQSGGKILSQLKRLGTFMDWSKERFTLDEPYCHSVNTAFVQLFRDGLITKKKRLVNWDSKLQSAVSDLEVDHVEEESQLYHLRYVLENQTDQGIDIFTTRPETLFGDVAIAVHPEDERYQHLIGRNVLVPLIARSISIIADSRVDPLFGSGAVKITPAHDFFDFEIALTHGLEFISILEKDGTLNHYAQKFQGQDRLQARDSILDALREEKTLLGQKAHISQIPYCSRTQERIEPFLTEQWYITMQPLAQEALNAYKRGDFTFVPAQWGTNYEQWLSNIQDWCISRQLIWGHRIPVWTTPEGQMYSGASEDDVRSFYGLSAETVLIQENDVLDTWFSSALWPFATLGWPEKEFDPQQHPFFPNQTLVSGFDIIFFWVARMIMFSLYFTKKVPFYHVYLHGIIQDAQGQKMSKSKGNVIDPIDLIDGISLEDLVSKRTSGMMQPEKAQAIAAQTQKDYPEGFPAFGTDALRMTFARFASPGRFLRFDINTIAIEQQTCHKLWNLMRFALPHLVSEPINSLNHPANIWVAQQTAKIFHRIEDHLAAYRFDLYVQDLIDFMWTTVCDQYVEISKVLLKDEAYAQETAQTLSFVLESLLSFLHPVVPFITEELHSIMRQHLDQSPQFLVQKRQDLSIFRIEAMMGSFDSQEVTMNTVFKLVKMIRTSRSKLNINPKDRLIALIDLSLEKEVAPYTSIFEHMIKVVFQHNERYQKNLDDVLVQGGDSSLAYTLVVPSSLLGEQKEKMMQEVQKIQQQLQPLVQRLEDPGFLAKAPQKVLEKDRAKRADLEAALLAAEQTLSSWGVN